MRRFPPVILALVVAAFGLSACGSAGSEDATSLIKDTFAANHPIRSGRVDATLDVDLQGLPTFTQPLSLHLSGPFQSNGGKTLPDFALDLDVQGGDRPVTVGATFAQGGGWLRLEGQAFDLGKDVTAAFRQGYLKAKADAAKRKGSQSALAALGIRPENWLKDPKTEGTEDIAGTETDHVSADVDVSRLLDDMSTVLARARSVTGQAAGGQVPTQLTPQQRAEIARSVKSASIDVWTGKDDHALRRFSLDVALGVPKELQASAGGLRSGHIALDLTIAQLNQRQSVPKPVSSRPLTDLRGALAQLGLLSTSSGGDSSSGSSSGSGASPTTATPGGSDPQAAYGQCLAKAGQDLAKVQKCAPLLK